MQPGRCRSTLRRVVILAACALPGTGRAVSPDSLPPGYPPMADAPANPPSAAKFALGRALFFERGLSANGSVSCADCHSPLHGFSDAVPISAGAFGRHGLRKTPSLLNVGYQTALMWDGRAPDLEHQIRLPLTGADEMATTEDAAAASLQGDGHYRAMFAAAFGDPAVTIGRIGQAVATFERSALIGSSAFHRYIFQGDAQAIPPAAQRGWRVFQDKGCITCHRFEGGNPFFTDFAFHNTGIGFEGASPDLGRYGTTKALADQGKFKTPGLIGVAQHAPYMHDGRLQTLRQVIDYYDRGGTPNRFLDSQMKPLRLTEAEKTELVAFLQALNPEAGTMPALAASGDSHGR